MFSGHAEDYRWPVIMNVVRSMTPYPRLAEMVCQFCIVTVYQITVLFLAACIPLEGLHRVSLSMDVEHITRVDIGFGVWLLGCILGAGIADEQQFRFYARKHDLLRRLDRGDSVRLTGDFARGFLTQGVFRYSRHPNYLFEILFWWSLAGYAVGLWYATGMVSYAMDFGWWLGAMMYTGVFLGSTPLAERISVKKYPDYKKYQKRTPGRILPWFSKPMGDAFKGVSPEDTVAARVKVKHEPGVRVKTE